MPIYEYRCDSCGHQEEHLQKVSEPPIANCPSCGKPAYRKLLSAAGFQLKGGGWYQTDFRNSGAKPAAKPAEAKSDNKAEAKVEAKSGEAKTGSKSEPASTTN